MDKMPAMIRMKLKKNPFGEPHIYINAASIHAIVPTRDGSTPAPLVLPCVMAGRGETLTVEALGRFGVSFKYNEDASVIVSGDDLAKVRAILDQQIAAWEAANGR